MTSSFGDNEDDIISNGPLVLIPLKLAIKRNGNRPSNFDFGATISINAIRPSAPDATKPLAPAIIEVKPPGFE